MAFDEALANRIREIMREHSGITERKMFGGLAFLVDGKMSVGVMGNDLMARVGPNGYLAALERPFARELDFTGRPMTGMVHVAAPGVEREGDLRAWCDQSVAYARSAPPGRKRTRTQGGRIESETPH